MAGPTHPSLTTDVFIDYLRSQKLASNVDLEEVQAVDLRDLKGVDDVLRHLETNIVLPLENDALANEFKLRSKRGVLLYGPPGTGKTTVGRAMAYRRTTEMRCRVARPCATPSLELQARQGASLRARRPAGRGLPKKGIGKRGPNFATFRLISFFSHRGGGSSISMIPCAAVGPPISSSSSFPGAVAPPKPL